MGDTDARRDNDSTDERDVMCGRCGSSMMWDDCFDCGGNGVIECDPIQCCDEHPCSRCDGLGGWYTCMSSEAYCQANPNVADVPPHTAHWFEIARPS